jgi:hypothetical protein
VLGVNLSIQDIGSIGEFISAIAVLITLLYLAIQVRAMRASMVVEYTAQTNQETAQLNKLDIEHANILLKAEEGLELTKEEEFVFVRVYKTHATFYFHQFYKVRIAEPALAWIAIRGCCEMLESNQGYRKLFEGYEYVSDPDENVREFMSLVHSELESRRNA